MTERATSDQQPILYLFDIDGTLLLSAGVGRTALERAFEDLYGVASAMNGIALAGRTDPLIVADMFQSGLGRAPSDHEITRLLNAYVPTLRSLLRDTPGFRLMPAVRETLDFLAAQREVMLAVATGNIERGARAKLERAGLWSRFCLGGYGDDSAERAELIMAAIARARANAEASTKTISEHRIVVVGDTPHDVSAARACGVKVLAVATGTYSRAALEQCGADAVFDTLAELPVWHTTNMASAPM